MQHKSELTLDQRRANVNKAKSKSPCFDCGQTGHWAGDDACPKPGARLGKGKGKTSKPGGSSKQPFKPKVSGKRHVGYVAVASTGKGKGGASHGSGKGRGELPPFPMDPLQLPVDLPPLPEGWTSDEADSDGPSEIEL